MIERMAYGKFPVVWVIRGMAARSLGVPFIGLRDLQGPEPSGAGVWQRVPARRIRQKSLVGSMVLRRLPAMP